MRRKHCKYSMTHLDDMLVCEMMILEFRPKTNIIGIMNQMECCFELIQRIECMVDIRRKLIEMMTQMGNHCIYKVHLDTHVACSCADCTQTFNLFQAIFFRKGKKLCFHLSSHEIWKKQNYKWKKKSLSFDVPLKLH